MKAANPALLRAHEGRVQEDGDRGGQARRQRAATLVDVRPAPLTGPDASGDRCGAGADGAQKDDDTAADAAAGSRRWPDAVRPTRSCPEMIDRCRKWGERGSNTDGSTVTSRPQNEIAQPNATASTTLQCRRKATAVTTSAMTIATTSGTRTRALMPWTASRPRATATDAERIRGATLLAPARRDRALPTSRRQVADVGWRRANRGGHGAITTWAKARLSGNARTPSTVVTTNAVPDVGRPSPARPAGESRARRRRADGPAAGSGRTGAGSRSRRWRVTTTLHRQVRARWPSAPPPSSRAPPPSPAPGPATRDRPR